MLRYWRPDLALALPQGRGAGIEPGSTVEP